MEVASLLDEVRREAEGLAREVSFADYLEAVGRNPKLARLAHARIYDMILASGVVRGPDGLSYGLFRDDVFGLDDVVHQLVEYFAASARRLEVRKRILLLVGPPGSGKSTLVSCLKRGLERHTRRPEGETYAIKGCPMHEEPLHLIPPHLRHRLPDVYVEGDLCPYCRWLVREVYEGDVAGVPVIRSAFSEAEGVGIGTFVATDPGSEDLSRLVGKVDLSRLKGADPEAARAAFRLDGELNAANRGLADLIEVFKMDERFLAVLLTLSQEQFIKAAGLGTIYADEVIMAHSNLAEYQALVGERKAAALQDRLVVLKVPYVLRVRDEVRIYRKMLDTTELSDVHLSPLALPVAATFAVLTRLAKPQRWGWTLRRKLQLYDGRFLPDAGPEDLAALRSESAEEGFTGVSPRYALNQLSQAVSRRPGCLSGMFLLEVLWEGLSQRAGFEERERETWSDLFSAAREEYDELVRRAVRRAQVSEFEAAEAALAQDVERELELWAQGRPDADLPTLRQVERALTAPQYRRDSWRTSLRLALQAARLLGADSPHRADPRLEEALERIVLPAWPEVARALRDQSGESESARQARHQFVQRLIAEQGFCELCAEDVVRHATRLASPSRGERAGPRALRWLLG